MKKSLKTYFVITFSVLSIAFASHVSAQTSNGAWPFVGSQLENSFKRIGSLVVGTSAIPGWFRSQGPSVGGSSRCINSQTVGDSNRLEDITGSESCLSVTGTSYFNKFTSKVPAYILKRALAGQSVQGTIALLGNISGFIVGDSSTIANESILVDGLKRINNHGQFVPRNTTTQRFVCANQEGILYPCTQEKISEIYHWDTGGWGACSNASGTQLCTGTYKLNTGGSCIDNGFSVNSGTCESSGPFGSATCGGLTISACKSHGGCVWKQTGPKCTSLSSRSSCENAGCSWQTPTDASCSAFGVESDCLSHAGCEWAQKTKERSVICKDSDNKNVADHFCIESGMNKPNTTESCSKSTASNWLIGDWGPCRELSGSRCDGGVYGSSDNYSCTGNYTLESEGSCTYTGSTEGTLEKVDWNGQPFDWGKGGRFDDESTDYTGICPERTYIALPSESQYWVYYKNGVVNNDQNASGYNPECEPLPDRSNPTEYTTTQKLYRTIPVDTSVCTKINSSTGCNAKTECTWKSGKTHSCSTLSSQSSCAGQAGCSWVVGSSNELKCSNLKTQSVCKSKGCTWKEGVSLKSRSVSCPTGKTCPQPKPATSESC